ncbi:MAG: isoamylase early set domain-containing protein [Nitrospira sp.]|nr:isoamylase early set domain-containing protein [Nitrospira sp.]MDH5194139.1 isoamylase early set domain-containing protein [Nitrospira sp.]
MKEPVKKASSSSRVTRSRKGPKTVSVMFEYFDPVAKIVTLVGEFNHWNTTARPMKRDAGGLWTVKLRLASGSYQYKFVINGERWEEDPLNLHRMMNEHGTFNSIRNVEASNDEGSAHT